MISGAEAQQLVREGALLLDVRNADEFQRGHLAGAVNLPLPDLATRNPVWPKGRAIVVYCHLGIRSTQAESLLRAQGFERVSNLGPMSRYDASL